MLGNRLTAGISAVFNRSRRSTFVMLFAMLVVADLVLSVYMPLKDRGWYEWTISGSTERFHRKIFDYLCSSKDPQVVVLGSSLAGVPSMATDQLYCKGQMPFPFLPPTYLFSQYKRADYLRKLLRESTGTKIDVVNLGVAGAVISDHLAILEKASQYDKHPSLVVCTIAPVEFMWSNGNDFHKTRIRQAFQSYSWPVGSNQLAFGADFVRREVVWHFDCLKKELSSFRTMGAERISELLHGKKPRPLPDAPIAVALNPPDAIKQQANKSDISGSAGSSAPANISGSVGTTAPANISGSAGTTAPPNISGSAGTTAPANISGSTGSTAPANISGSVGTTAPANISGSAGTTAAANSSGSAGSTAPSNSSGSTGSPTPANISGSAGSTTPNTISGSAGSTPTNNSSGSPASTAPANISRSPGSTNAAPISAAEQIMLKNLRAGNDRWGRKNGLSDLAMYKRNYSNFNEPVFKQHVENYEKMLEHCNKHGIPLVVVNMPLTRQNRALIAKPNYAKYYNTVTNLALTHNTPFIDMDKDESFVLSDFFDSTHLNDEGGKKFFELLTARLSQHNLQQVAGTGHTY